MRKIISFDFDGVLSEQRFQDLVQDIIKLGFEIIIVTSRPHHSSKPRSHGNNSDIYNTVRRLNIPERNILFCNYQPKYLFLGERVFMHIDDCDVTLKEIEVEAPEILTIKHIKYSNKEILDMLPIAFSDEKIKELEDQQGNPTRHPYTCDGNGRCCEITSISRNLVPKPAGWVCNCGEYFQNWSH